MRKKFKFILICASVFFQSYSQQEKGLFFSEYTAQSWNRVLEIFNPTADTIDLSRYSIVRNDDFQFDFPGGVLPPFQTWVGARNEPTNPPHPMVLAAADTTWPAANSIWFLSNTAKIELMKDNLVIDRINGDPRNGNVAGVTDALLNYTLIRKPHIYKGETDWDVARGINTDDSQWIVQPVSFSDLGKHTTDLPDPTLDSTITLISEVFRIENDTIFLEATLPVDSVLQSLLPAGRASLFLLDPLGNAIGSGMIQSAYHLRVTAEAGNIHYYVFHIDVPVESLIELESMVYVVGEDNLSGISHGTHSEKLLSNLLLFPAGVNARVTDNAGNPKTGGVDTGDMLELTALDGSTKKLLVLNCHEPVSPSEYQVHRIAQPRVLPVGAPSYSDVNMTSRWPRTPGLREGNALLAGKSFHGTNFRWCGLTHLRDFEYPGTDQWVRDEIKGNGYRIAASMNHSLSDVVKSRIIFPGSRAEKEDGSTVESFCPNKPLGRQAYMDHVHTAVEMGSDYSIQQDGARLIVTEEEVCYCRYCREKASEWGLIVASVEFKERSVVEFWQWVQSETPKYTGRRIGYSANNGSYHYFTDIYRQFDFYIGECDPRWSYGPDKYFSDERLSAEPLGKMQVFNLSVKGLVIEDSTLVWRNRSITGLGYGTGGNVIVPWDTWMHPPVEERRYFGNPEEYADLFGFIRASTRFLEGYETAFDYMPNYNDPRYGGAKPVTITGNNRAFAYVRAVPGDSLAAVVVHLVDWKESPEPMPMVINIHSGFFFSGRDFGIYLSEPVPYDEGIHQSVTDNADLHLRPGSFRGTQHEAIYNPLRKLTKLVPERNGTTLSVSIDSIPTYAHLVLVPSGHPWRVTSGEYLADQEGMMIRGHTPGDYTSELLSKLERSPLTSWMVLDSKGLPVYGELGENNQLVVLSPGGRKLLRYSLDEGESHGLEVSYNLEPISAGSVFDFEGVAVGTAGEEYVFTLKNVSMDVFHLDTILVPGEGFTVDHTIGELPHGGSGEFRLRFQPGSRGLQSAVVNIKNASQGILPFVFHVSGDGLSAGMEVYQGGDWLRPGTGIVDLGSAKTSSGNQVELKVLNPGEVLLEIGEVRVNKPGLLSVVAFDGQVLPGDTGLIVLTFTPSAVQWESVQLTIVNSSFPFGEYSLYGEGFGLAPEPKLVVEQDGMVLVHNTGVVDFGNVLLNEPEFRRVVVRNTGEDALLVSAVTSGMADFQVVSRPERVEANASDTIVIRFNPLMKMSYGTNITITTNDSGNSPFRFAVTGRGTDVTGVNKPEQAGLRVYPNPASGSVKVEYPGAFSLRVIDASGKVWIKRTDVFDSNDLNLESLRGIYFLEIVSDKGVLVEKLVVK